MDLVQVIGSKAYSNYLQKERDIFTLSKQKKIDGRTLTSLIKRNVGLFVAKKKLSEEGKFDLNKDQRK